MIPTRIGQKFEGGYFTGVIRIKGLAYAILTAPKFTERSTQFKTAYSMTPGIQLVNDGWTNTNAMDNTEHPAAQHCRSLNVSGHTDLYLPSRDELELCYRNLKPTGRSNTTYTGTYTSNFRLANGTNRSSIPTGDEYTSTNPAQTNVTAFRTGSVEAFETSNYYWTSTESSFDTNTSLIWIFSNGCQNWGNKTDVGIVRGVRRVLILLNDEEHNDTN